MASEVGAPAIPALQRSLGRSLSDRAWKMVKMALATISLRGSEQVKPPQRGVLGMRRTLADDFNFICTDMPWHRLVGFVVAVYLAFAAVFAGLLIVLAWLEGEEGWRVHLAGELPVGMGWREACLWYSLTNLLTVGYGPMEPASRAAYLLGSAQCFMGILLSSLLLGIVVNKVTKPKVGFQNVLIIGGTGAGLGQNLTKGLLSASPKLNVTVLTRDVAPLDDTAKKARLDSFVAEGAVIKQVSAIKTVAEHVAELADLFQGVDVVVSAVGASAIQDQKHIIEACRIAGVKRFIPSEFGIDPPKFPKGYSPLFDAKQDIQDCLKASGIDYTIIQCGFITEASFYTGVLGFDASSGKITVKGNLDVPFTITSARDIGTFLPLILADPASKNAVINLAGEEVTWRKAVAIYEEAFGKKFEVVETSTEDLRKEVAAGIWNFPNPWVKIIEQLQLAIADGYALIKGTPWNKTHPEAAGMKLLTLKELAAAAAAGASSTCAAQLYNSTAAQLYSLGLY